MLWVVRNGVPYEMAAEMEPWELLAHYAVFAAFEGNEMDWRTGALRQK